MARGWNRQYRPKGDDVINTYVTSHGGYDTCKCGGRKRDISRQCQRCWHASRHPKVRFWERVSFPDENGCIAWRGAVREDGYARIRVQERGMYVHRFAYELLVGPIPGDLTVDHLCRNRSCVAPDHLRLVTLSENSAGGHTFRTPKTECKHGHSFDEGNTYVHPRTGHRLCRRCRANQMAGRPRAA